MNVDKAYQAGDQASLAGRLLAHAATREPLDIGVGATAHPSEGGGLRQFQWVIAGGLGPLLLHALQASAALVPHAWREALTSADLVARIRQAERVETTLEIIAACDAEKAPILLLKGISTSEQWYPAEHLRPMSDIDALVPGDAYAAIEARLLELGYFSVDDWPDAPGHHHGRPLCHPRLDTIVELHTGLFTDDSPLVEGGTFEPSRVVAQSDPSRYHGRAVRRLTPEFQLAYIASSWFNDIRLHNPHPTFMPAAFDAIYLLAATGATLDWNRLLDDLDNEMAIASLYTMVTYLARYGVDPPPRPVLARLAASQTFDGPVRLRLIHRMLDKYLLGGQPWSHRLLPPVPARYSLRYQFRKRVLGRLHPRRS